MRNYYLAVTATEQTQSIRPSKYLLLTAGAANVQVKFGKSPTQTAVLEGDFQTLKANTTTRMYTRKGAFWWIIHKTAVGTSTLTVLASDNEVVPENTAWWTQETLKQIEVPSTAGNVLTLLSPSAGKRWFILLGSMSYVSDATVVTRKPYVFLLKTGAINSGSNSVNRLATLFYNSTGVTASTVTSSTISTANAINALLSAGQSMLLGADNGVAGDVYTAYLNVLECDAQ